MYPTNIMKQCLRFYNIAVKCHLGRRLEFQRRRLETSPKSLLLINGHLVHDARNSIDQL